MYKGNATSELYRCMTILFTLKWVNCGRTDTDNQML